jgi:hypothetical protein
MTTTPCESDPDRWADGSASDLEAARLCREMCPSRARCIRLALECDDAGKPISGIIGGIYIGESGRRRAHAITLLKGLSAYLKEQVPA